MRARVVLVALCGLLLASACGSSGTTDGGNNSAWAMVVPPGSSVYTAVWVDTPGTIYAVERGSIFPGYGASYSTVASHDDGASWTTVPLTDSGATINAVAAVGSTDVYAV